LRRWRGREPRSVGFVLTDPRYLLNYQDRSGRGVTNDDNSAWFAPAFAQIFDVLKPNSFCVSFYSWNKADIFMTAWRAAAFRVVGHIVFRKQYSSSARFLQYRHEQAYLLAKGYPDFPDQPPPDVIGCNTPATGYTRRRSPSASFGPSSRLLASPEMLS
jgi:site-specific DNA-methyltransferase (adenine-specific)